MSPSTTLASDPGSWSHAVAELGLDHPAIWRLASTRHLLERAHQVHEQRRALHVQVADAEEQLRSLRASEAATVAEGLALLAQIQADIDIQTADLASISTGLQTSLRPADPDHDATPATHDLADFVERHDLRRQYEALLDMFSAFGAFDLRSRAVQFHGSRSGRMHGLPAFDDIARSVITDELRSHLAYADHVRLLVTPVADHRIFQGIGKTIAFCNYAVGGAGREGPEACAAFIDRLRDKISDDPLIDRLLGRSPFDGVVVSLYAESRTATDHGDLHGVGLPLETTREAITVSSTAAAEAGLDARPLSPPEYLLVQTLRRREGRPPLDGERSGAARAETWFPDHQVADAPGTLVARSVGHGVRFRADDLGKGFAGRGYRMTYAAAA